MTQTDIAARIKKLRLKNDYSQDTVANCLNMSQAKYCRLEKGDSSLSHLDAIALCEFYKEPYERLLPDSMALAVEQVERIDIEKLKGKYKLLLSALVMLCNKHDEDVTQYLAQLV